MSVSRGGGFAFEDGREFSVPNPVIQPKLLIWRAEEDGFPGLAVSTEVTLPVGTGPGFEDATGFYAIAPLTSRLLEDWAIVHLNVGFTSAFVSPDRDVDRSRDSSCRPYWGVGADVGVVHPDARLIGEAYSGDPFQALGARYAFQWGGRWMTNDYVNLDLTFGTQPLVEDGRRVGGKWVGWVQIGVRLLFDAFTDGPGDPMGAYGMMPPPRL